MALKSGKEKIPSEISSVLFTSPNHNVWLPLFLPTKGVVTYVGYGKIQMEPLNKEGTLFCNSRKNRTGILLTKGFVALDYIEFTSSCIYNSILYPFTRGYALEESGLDSTTLRKAVSDFGSRVYPNKQLVWDGICLGRTELEVNNLSPERAQAMMESAKVRHRASGESELDFPENFDGLVKSDEDLVKQFFRHNHREAIYIRRVKETKIVCSSITWKVPDSSKWWVVLRKDRIKTQVDRTHSDDNCRPSTLSNTVQITRKESKDSSTKSGDNDENFELQSKSNNRSRNKRRRCIDDDNEESNSQSHTFSTLSNSRQNTSNDEDNEQTGCRKFKMRSKPVSQEPNSEDDHGASQQRTEGQPKPSLTVSKACLTTSNLPQDVTHSRISSMHSNVSSQESDGDEDGAPSQVRKDNQSKSSLPVSNTRLKVSNTPHPQDVTERRNSQSHPNTESQLSDDDNTSMDCTTPTKKKRRKSSQRNRRQSSDTDDGDDVNFIVNFLDNNYVELPVTITVDMLKMPATDNNFDWVHYNHVSGFMQNGYRLLRGIIVAYINPERLKDINLQRYKRTDLTYRSDLIEQLDPVDGVFGTLCLKNMSSGQMELSIVILH